MSLRLLLTAAAPRVRVPPLAPAATAGRVGAYMAYMATLCFDRAVCAEAGPGSGID
jgi:hypothetical protein